MTIRPIVPVVLILAGGCVAFVIYKSWQSMNAAAYDACVASLTDDIWHQQETKDLAERSTGWKILSKDEIDLVIKNVKGGDCSQSADLRFDPQKHRVNVAIRKDERGAWPPIIIWSNGPDGEEGTEDDVVMPYGLKIPR